MTSKHILFMIHNMNLGGTEKALLSFINSLNRKKVKVTVLLLEKNGVLLNQIPDWVKIDVINNFEIIKPIIFEPPLQQIKKNLLNGYFFSVLKNSMRYLKVKLSGAWYHNYEYALKKYSVTHDVDIAVAFAGPSDFITYYIHKCVNAPIKYQWIHFDVRKVIFKTNFGNKYYPFFDKIFCVSENAKQVFNEMFPKFINKTEVFKNIISKQQLEELAITGKTFTDNFEGLRIVTIGRLSKEKGQQMIPDIITKLKGDNLIFKWYLIGDGLLSDELSSKVNKLKLHNELILLGAKINPYRYLKDCDIYVQTSFHEGYCLTVHEAKLFNKPVVVTNVASASNLIVNKKDGLIVNINEESLYKGVKALIENQSLRNSFEKNLISKETVNEINKIGL